MPPPPPRLDTRTTLPRDAHTAGGGRPGRHDRQRLLAGIGPAGQDRIASSCVLIAGVGALGGVLAETLCRAGVGRLVLIDRDVVEETNLQRQVLFTEKHARAGVPKATAAAERLREIDSSLEIEAHVVDLTAANVEALCGVRGSGRRVDCLADGLDHFATRFLLDDVSVKHALPYAYGGAVGTTGTALCLLPRTAGRATAWEAAGVATPSLRELVPEPPAAGATPTCDSVGVLGPLIHLVASCQAADILKVLVGDWAAVNPRLLHADLWENRFGHLDVAALVPEAARTTFEFLDNAPRSAATTLCGRGAVQVSPAPGTPSPNLLSTADALPAAAVLLGRDAELLRFRLDAATFTVFPDGRVLVQGVDGPEQARSLVARVLGG